MGYPYLGERELTDDEREKLKVLVQKIKNQRRIAWVVGIASACLLLGGLIYGSTQGEKFISWTAAILVMLGLPGFFWTVLGIGKSHDYVNIAELARATKVATYGQAGSGMVLFERLEGTDLIVSLNGEPQWMRGVAKSFEVPDFKARQYPDLLNEPNERRLTLPEVEELRYRASQAFPGLLLFHLIWLISQTRWVLRSIAAEEYAQLTLSVVLVVFSLGSIAFWLRQWIRNPKLGRDIERGRMLVSQSESGEVIEVLAESGKVWTRNGIPEPWRYSKA